MSLIYALHLEFDLLQRAVLEDNHYKRFYQPINRVNEFRMELCKILELAKVHFSSVSSLFMLKSKISIDTLVASLEFQ